MSVNRLTNILLPLRPSAGCSKLVDMPRYPGDPTAELTGTLDAIPSKTPTAAVASKLLAYFTSGGLPMGSRLPAERALAEMLGTGRSAVREALAALEILGVVEVRPGSGTYLRSQVSELLPHTLNWGLMIAAQDVAELVEIRSSLEVLAARLAALQGDAASLARLGDHVTSMSEHVDLEHHQEFIEADAHFHQEIAAAADNSTLAGLLQSVRALLRVWVDRSVDSQQDASQALAEHRLVVEALVAGDPEAAAAAMTAHMSTAQARLLSAHAQHED